MVNYREKLEKLFLLTAQQNASDLHLSVGFKPTLRIDGNLIPIAKEAVLNSESSEGLVHELLSDGQRATLKTDREVDFAYAFGDKARFRVNAFYQRGFLTAALRLIPSDIKTIEALSLPPVLHDFTKLAQGFVLVVGPAGHGKSTTLAAMLDEINHNRMDHIITIEDPSEY